MRPTAKRVSEIGEEIIVDNFAGGGGASTGIEVALGRSVDIAINHDPEAIEMHARNHPQTKHLCESVWDVDPAEACAGRPVGVAWFSPDCFPAGTLVLTRTGYRPIEEIEIGDEVLTHLGRWRKVVETHQAIKPLRMIRGHGHPGILCTNEHPFYTRLRTDRRDDTKKEYWFLDLPGWTPAEFLTKKHYWATPTKFPAAECPEVPGRGLDLDSRLMWLAGRYVGDGWTRLTETRAELVIICGEHESFALRQKLEEMWPRQGDRAGKNELGWNGRMCSTAFQLSTNHRGLVTWLRSNFGHGAASKHVPTWLLGLPAAMRGVFLSGYLSADGHRASTFWECTTISKSLAFGIKAVANSLGRTVSVYYYAKNTTEIEGRTVNAQPWWRLRWRDEVEIKHCQTQHDDEGLEWCPIRENVDAGTAATVFNIGVEEDESYVVEGIIVHNCKHFSRAKGAKPVSKKIRGLAWVAVKWAKKVRPRVIFLENVREFQEWGPLGADNRPCPNRKGETFKRFLRSLKKLGYAAECRVLNAADYGAPTHRRRLFLVARRDGRPIVWPEPTHGPGRPHPYRTAAECIDWSIPCPSIFERKRPLAEKKLRRIAMGLKRYVLENPRPFIVNAQHGGDHFRGQPVTEPLHTVTTKDRFGLVTIDGQDYQIADIGLRMLTPRELLRAQFGPELAADYILPRTASAAVAKIGNSVAPLCAAAIVRANCPDLIVMKRKRRSA